MKALGNIVFYLSVIAVVLRALHVVSWSWGLTLAPLIVFVVGVFVYGIAKGAIEASNEDK